MRVHCYQIQIDPSDSGSAMFIAHRGASIRQIVAVGADFYAFAHENPEAEMCAHLLNVFDLDGGDPGSGAFVVPIVSGPTVTARIFADAGEADL